jgi:exopolyphosphatase/pppGpp-phosphohydrolase
MTQDIERRYAALRTGCPEGSAVTVLHIGAQQTLIASGTGAQPDATFTLALGSHKTAADLFQHQPPTPAELENAIMVVEDELFGVRALAANASVLHASDPALHQIALLAGAKDGAEVTLPVDAVERLFDALAARVLGRPASSAGIPDDTAFAATLLILREFMHHLQFASIRIVAPARSA